MDDDAVLYIQIAPVVHLLCFSSMRLLFPEFKDLPGPQEGSHGSLAVVSMAMMHQSSTQITHFLPDTRVLMVMWNKILIRYQVSFCDSKGQ